MTPTMKLRFVERGDHVVLQQWWSYELFGMTSADGEWRDVPLEKLK